MKIVLDASMSLAWHLKRASAKEAALAQSALKRISVDGAVVPGLWYPKVANGLLIAERRGITSQHGIAAFWMDVSLLDILLDSASPDATVGAVLTLARASGLTAYDATYLELVLRTGRTLATFDRQLADAARKAGGRVFGDAP